MTRRTVTLTGAEPVSIEEEEWPTVAWARANGIRGIHSLTVRRHADGRHLIYGVSDARLACARDARSCRAGRVVEPDAELAYAVTRVARESGVYAQTLRECLAGLPAKKI